MDAGELTPENVSGQRVRLGVVSYLNTLPLVQGLDGDPSVDLLAGPPSHVSEWLATGRVDFGLVPVVDLLGRLDLTIVSDACIGGLGDVTTVLLMLRRAPGRVKRLALDPHSRTSQVLAQICLDGLYGVRPVVEVQDPVRAWSDGNADAVLVIGDQAFSIRETGRPFLDLGAAWFELTGLPFVFAAWVGRPEGLARWPGLPARLEAARDKGVANLDDIVARAAPGAPVSPDALRVYLERRIRYRLAAPERLAITRFLEAASPFVQARGPAERGLA